MKKRGLKALLVTALILGFGMAMNFMAFAADPATIFVHDPRFNATAMADVLVDPEAVYGFRPNPLSKSIGKFALSDWTDPEVVEKARQERIAYHENMSSMYETLITMAAEGKSVEEIARTVSRMRNELRKASYKDNPEGLELMKQRNLEKYGNEDGPTPESLYEKLGSWEAVAASAFSTNPGMDACLGIYDDYHIYYIFFGQVTGEETEIRHTVGNNESLQLISLRYYGTPDKWNVIYANNKDKIKNADVIKTGTVLALPR